MWKSVKSILYERVSSSMFNQFFAISLSLRRIDRYPDFTTSMENFQFRPETKRSSLSRWNLCRRILNGRCAILALSPDFTVKRTASRYAEISRRTRSDFVSPRLFEKGKIPAEIQSSRVSENPSRSVLNYTRWNIVLKNWGSLVLQCPVTLLVRNTVSIWMNKI